LKREVNEVNEIKEVKDLERGAVVAVRKNWEGWVRP
jgi:hypothetical protein